MKIKRIVIYLSRSSFDKVCLETNLPCPFPETYDPSQQSLTVSFETTKDTAIEYVKKHFPYEPAPEIINL